MTFEHGSGDSEHVREGKIRLSLIDVIYGVVLGYGFNFFVDKDPTDVTAALFLLTVAAIVCDWLFVHKPYWNDPGSYSNLPFAIDLLILLAFAFMIRFASKPPYGRVVLVLGIVFTFYALWDLVFFRSLKQQGRSYKVDFFWDAVGAAAFYALFAYQNTQLLSRRIFEIDLPTWIGLDSEVQIWVALAALIYIFMGPHPLADVLKLRRIGRSAASSGKLE